MPTTQSINDVIAALDNIILDAKKNKENKQYRRRWMGEIEAKTNNGTGLVPRLNRNTNTGSEKKFLLLKQQCRITAALLFTLNYLFS